MFRVTPMEEPARAPSAIASCELEMLEFGAPWLIEKLCKLGLAEHEQEGEALFREVKRYLLLALEAPTGLAMPSARIDEVWHQFILFTREYAAFCQRFAGRYLHHAPTESAPTAGAEPGVDDFRASYEARFGPLPALWSDERSLTARSRVARANARDVLGVRIDERRVELVREGRAPVTLCRVSVRAEAALRFVARESQFLVRELPGLAGDEERIALLSPLVRFRILRLAP